MRNTFIFVLAFLATITAFNSLAEDKKSPLAILLETSSGNLTQSQRKESADELLRRIKALDAYVPSLTPKESQWLDEEWNSLSTLPTEASNQKAFTLLNTTEYQTRELKNGIEEIKSYLECAKTAAGAAIKREMFCWASASYKLTDRGQFNDSIRIMMKNGRISLSSIVRADLGLSPFPDDDVWIGFNMYGRLIQSKIVLPYMADMISK
jgi:hypothetical protein